MVSTEQAGFLALRDRAYGLLVGGQAVAEEILLEHVYGGPAPAALRGKLAAPLLGDPRLERRSDGSWTIAASSVERDSSSSFTTLALVATGPTPARARIVRLSAHHVAHGETSGRFDVTLNPGKRVPRYVTERLGLEPAMLDDLPLFAEVLDDLVRFLAMRPIFAQEARMTWAFVEAEARGAGRAMVEPRLVDANKVASDLLGLKGKPNLARVAARLDIGAVQPGRADEDARLLALVASRLISMAGVEAVLTSNAAAGSSTPLRRSETARALPDVPGVYVLRDSQRMPLYVGKARRLRSRMAAYVHRPLGPTRRLEGLVAAVDAVEAIQCATDLEALVLEDRHIRQLSPRFNTVRQQRKPRLWIRLPPEPPTSANKRQPAPRRLELSLGPPSADGEFVGPFRNATLAQQARLLARDVFDLDRLRRADPRNYAARLGLAWAFLNGDSGPAEELARARSARLLRQVVSFDIRRDLLPADPRCARYALVRPGPAGIEGFLIDSGVLRAWTLLDADDFARFAADLLSVSEPRTSPDDVDVVLRWLGGQRPPARLVALSDDLAATVDAIEAAASDLAWEP